jgi:SagB-type dehydrogenase family enzyme
MEAFMKMASFLMVVLSMFGLVLCSSLSRAADPAPLPLPKPQMEGGKPLMQALKERASLREFSGEKLPLQILSDMLWAAHGVNRPDSGKRTAPSARNWQEMDVYVAAAAGLYLYDPKEHTLKPILSEDIRALTGTQPFVKDVPVNLIYVADYSKIGEASTADKEFYSAADTGFISQNVYLYCASEGLATVVRGLIDRYALAKAMRLRPDQKITLAQSVGYPKK